MKKNILKIGIILLVFIVGLKTVNAASYTISVGSRSLTKGGKTTLTIRGSGVTGRFNISTSNSSVVAISEDRAWIENDSYGITLSALNVGTATITVTPSGVSDSSGNTANLGAKTIKITVSLPREKSNDNNLKSLTVEGYEISPTFDKDIQVYSAIVPEGTKTVNVKAITNESHATVSGTGDIEVTNGQNVINVTVKSETGLEKIYTINIEVKDNNPIPVTLNNNNYTLVKLQEYLTKPEFYEETTVQINDYDIPAFYNNATNTTIVGLKDEVGSIVYARYENNEFYSYNEITTKNYLLIPTSFTQELDLIKTTITINDEEFDAYKYSEKSKYYIISAQNLEDGQTNMYVYDEESKTAQIFDEAYINETNETIKNYTYVIISFAGALVVTLIIIIILLISLRKKQKKIKKFVKKQEAKIEATMKLNDVVNEVKKITEESKNNDAIPKEKNKNKKKKNASKSEEKIEVNEIKANEIKANEIKVPEEPIKEAETTDKKNQKNKEDKQDKEEVYDLFGEDKKKKKKKK